MEIINYPLHLFPLLFPGPFSGFTLVYTSRRAHLPLTSKHRSKTKMKGSYCCLNATEKTLKEESSATCDQGMGCNPETKVLAFPLSLGIQEMAGLQTWSPQTIFQQQLHSNKIHTLQT